MSKLLRSSQPHSPKYALQLRTFFFLKIYWRFNHTFWHKLGLKWYKNLKKFNQIISINAYKKSSNFSLLEQLLKCPVFQAEYFQVISLKRQNMIKTWSSQALAESLAFKTHMPQFFKLSWNPKTENQDWKWVSDLYRDIKYFFSKSFIDRMQGLKLKNSGLFEIEK